MAHPHGSAPARPVQTDAARAFWAWRARHLRQADDPQAVWAAGWNAGGAAAIYETSTLAGLVPAVERLTAYLESQYAENHDGSLAGSPSDSWAL